MALSETQRLAEHTEEGPRPRQGASAPSWNHSEPEATCSGRGTAWGRRKDREVCHPSSQTVSRLISPFHPRPAVLPARKVCKVLGELV